MGAGAGVAASFGKEAAEETAESVTTETSTVFPWASSAASLEIDRFPFIVKISRGAQWPRSIDALHLEPPKMCEDGH